MAMEAIWIKSYNTYSKIFTDLIEWEFFTLIQKSVNQYSANIIAISKIDKATNKALDKAMIKHKWKQRESTSESTSESNDSIDIQETSIQETNLQVREPSEYKISIDYLKSYTLETEIPDYAENYRDEWIKFCIYWWEKGKTGKIRAEWEKTFEIKKRFATWMSRKKEQYEKTKTNKNSIITF